MSGCFNVLLYVKEKREREKEGRKKERNIKEVIEVEREKQV